MGGILKRYVWYLSFRFVSDWVRVLLCKGFRMDRRLNDRNRSFHTVEDSRHIKFILVCMKAAENKSSVDVYLNFFSLSRRWLADGKKLEMFNCSGFYQYVSGRLVSMLLPQTLMTLASEC